MMQRPTLCRSHTKRCGVTPIWLSAPSGQVSAKIRRMPAQRARQVPLVLADRTSAGQTAGKIHTSIWERFSNQASGEWEGITATFSPSGSPQQLPEHYVPEAFREWGVELYDWQCQCSSYASTTPEGDYQYSSMLRRLMPTVGCEADAIAFTEEHSGGGSDKGAGRSSSICEVTAVRADGSYNSGPAGWPSAADETVTALQIEHCFMEPMQQPDQQQQQRHRVKVVQKFKRNGLKNGAWELTAVDLHRERYDRPYTGRRDLAGCGGGQSAIAQLPPLTSLGNWVKIPAAQGREGSEEVLVIGGSGSRSGNNARLVDRSNYRESIVQGVNDHYVTSAIQRRQLFHLTMLPLNAWSRVVTTKTGCLLKAEAGVSFDNSRQVVSVRTYVTQRLPREYTGDLKTAIMVDQAGLLDAVLMDQQIC